MAKAILRSESGESIAAGSQRLHFWGESKRATSRQESQMDAHKRKFSDCILCFVEVGTFFQCPLILKLTTATTALGTRHVPAVASLRSNSPVWSQTTPPLGAVDTIPRAHLYHGFTSFLANHRWQ